MIEESEKVYQFLGIDRKKKAKPQRIDFKPFLNIMLGFDAN